ncbi:MAG: M48 family metalloprotease, partial [Desulfobacterales bacterium]
MRFYRKSSLVHIMVAIMLSTLIPHQAYAITTKKEKEMSEEFKEAVFSYFEVINDPLITDYVNRVGQRIMEKIPPQPFDYHFYVIKESQYNAFAGPGGLIFIHSGLFIAMESEEELAGILAHEISHVTNRHISDRAGRSTIIGIATLAALAAGILLGASGGSAEISEAMTIGGM